MAYLSPGVYVEEVPSSIKPIAGVGTSTAAFVGVVPDTVALIAKADAKSSKLVDFDLKAKLPAATPKLFTSWSQFAAVFGGLVGDASKTKSTATQADTAHRYLAHAVYGFFNNGGTRAYVVRAAAPEDFQDALDALKPIDEISLVVAPGVTADAQREAVVAHCKSAGDRFAIVDGPATADLAALKGPMNSDYAAWYFPWISVYDPATQLSAPDGDGLFAVPPSGHIAGIYARVDAQRGVHKAPANEAILGALGTTQALSKADQDGLNPGGINAIRALNGNIWLWGARTAGGDANADLKYINVRRTLLFLRESIEEGTQWIVFEPNTPALWQKINRNVTAFLTGVWRSGALFGNTAAEAFYVKCDADTNPPEQREQGLVVTEIGVALAKPAEFVVFRISQTGG